MKDILHIPCEYIFRVQFESTKRKSSSQTKNCDDSATAEDVVLKVARSKSSLEAMSGQEKIYGVDGEEVVMTIRTNEEPDE